MDPVELRRVNDSMKDADRQGMVEPLADEVLRRGRRGLRLVEARCRARLDARRRLADRLGLRQRGLSDPYRRATARVQLNADGHARVQIAAHEIGTGVMTVVGADGGRTARHPARAGEVEMGDSSLPPAPVAGGSNQTASCCSVVMKACDAMTREAQRRRRQSGNRRCGRQRASAANSTGSACRRSRNMPSSCRDDAKPNAAGGLFTDPIKKLYEGTPTLVGGSHGKKLMYAMGAEFVEVRVHAQTREIRVPRIVGAFAAGRIMNTRTARSQYMGAMIWGISSALHEATEIDPRNARYINDNLADYLMPVNADIQQLEVILVPEKDDSVNPAGVKGIGELGNVGTAAAVANAVYHATGIRVRELPIRLEKLLVT